MYIIAESILFQLIYEPSLTGCFNQTYIIIINDEDDTMPDSQMSQKYLLLSYINYNKTYSYRKMLLYSITT